MYFPCFLRGFILLFMISFFVFLQAGSLQLMPVSVEITYGLERILMLLQVTLERCRTPYCTYQRKLWVEKP